MLGTSECLLDASAEFPRSFDLFVCRLSPALGELGDFFILQAVLSVSSTWAAAFVSIRTLGRLLYPLNDPNVFQGRS